MTDPVAWVFRGCWDAPSTQRPANESLGSHGRDGSMGWAGPWPQRPPDNRGYQRGARLFLCYRPVASASMSPASRHKAPSRICDLRCREQSGGTAMTDHPVPADRAVPGENNWIALLLQDD